MTREAFVQELLANLRAAGFCCDEHPYIGPIEVVLYGSKKVRWFLLGRYHLHCYLFVTSEGVQPNAPYVLGLNSLARGFIDRFKNRRSRYLRWTIPVTMTLVFSEGGFTEDAVAEISSRKQRYQVGDINVVILLDGSTMSVHRLARVGLIGCFPLLRVHRLACALLGKMGFRGTSS